MKKLALLCCLLGASCGAWAQLDQDSMINVLRMSQRIALRAATFETRLVDVPATVKLGQKFVVKVEIAFPEGWHGYAPAPVEEGILTSVEVASNPSILSARAKMPAPTTTKPNAHIYEGTITVPVEVILKPSITGKKVQGTVKVTAQMCNEASCLPPETKELPVTFTINYKNGDRTPEEQKKFNAAKKARKAAKKKRQAKRAAEGLPAKKKKIDGTDPGTVTPPPPPPAGSGSGAGQ